MAGKVFINHRRDLSERDAEILFNRLVMGGHVAETDLFIDRRGLDRSPNWKATLKAQVHASEVMVVVIGDGEIAGKPVNWLDIQHPADHRRAGQRRFDDPEDFVRYEIVEAIDLGIPLVPVLVNGARMPPRDALPLDMWPLTQPQALELRTKAGALPETYVAKIGEVIAARRAEHRRSKARVVSPAMMAVLMTVTAVLGAAAAIGVTPLAKGPDPADDLMVRNLKLQIVDYRRLVEEANAKVAARSPQLKQIDPSGPWGIAWKWVSPKCEGGYNLVVDQSGIIAVYGKGEKLMKGSGTALSNGRFFVKFTIDTGRSTLTADGGIATGAGEAQLHTLADPEGAPYCQGPFTISRGKLPAILVGGGNGGGN